MSPTQSAQATVIVEVFDIRDAARMEQALAIRTRVFVEEQGIPLDEEIDAHDHSDPAARHALAYASEGGGAPLGTARYYIVQAGCVQIGRMAVAAAQRGKGVGTALLDALLADARRHGFARAHLHAQLHATEFYRRSGFVDDGDALWDGGILHQPMSRTLARQDFSSQVPPR